MPFHQPDSIRYYTFDSLSDAGLTHAVFTRQGGVSQAPWSSLNLGSTVGDDPAHVAENRRRAVGALGRRPESIYDVWQVHSADVVCTTAPRPEHEPHLKADAILTDRPDVTLFMRFADCVPIILYDPGRKVVGLAHAGWQGTVRGTVSASVQALVDQYGSSPADILAAIGPSIGPHHYTIGPEVVEQVGAAFGAEAPDLLPSSEGRVQFDLWKANRRLLERAGVLPEHIEVAGICTACHLEDWFSHRAEKGQTGRFGVLASVP